ncbi:MAG: acetyl-CoA carboxylase, biotin carboxyl carrier protein, partial [Balneolaceae bacterium]
MDLKLVKKLLDLISDSEVDEVSIEEGDFKLKVKKNADAPPATVHYQAPPQQQATQAPAASPAPAESEKPSGKESSEPDGEV